VLGGWGGEHGLPVREDGTVGVQGLEQVTCLTPWRLRRSGCSGARGALRRQVLARILGKFGGGENDSRGSRVCSRRLPIWQIWGEAWRGRVHGGGSQIEVGGGVGEGGRGAIEGVVIARKRTSLVGGWTGGVAARGIESKRWS
jgi:hypothetical protein